MALAVLRAALAGSSSKYGVIKREAVPAPLLRNYMRTLFTSQLSSFADPASETARSSPQGLAQQQQDKPERSDQTKIHITIPPRAPPTASPCNFITPADPKSRLRAIRFYKPVEGESASQRDYRQHVEAAQDLCQNFWTTHNQAYVEGKRQFAKEHAKKMGVRPEELTSDDLSHFYKEFLSSRHKALLAFNKDWHKLNFKTIWLALKVLVSRS